MALDATVKGSAANSYNTVATGDTYFADRLDSDEWTGATTPKKSSALITATRILDASFDYVGAKTTTDQKLRHPRVGLLNLDHEEYDQDAIAEPIEQSVNELALSLLQRDRQKEPDLLGQGFNEAILGSMEVVVDKKMVLDLIPPIVLTLMRGLGSLKPEGVHGDRVVPVLRG